jgi:hypothetical protein
MALSALSSGPGPVTGATLTDLLGTTSPSTPVSAKDRFSPDPPILKPKTDGSYGARRPAPLTKPECLLSVQLETFAGRTGRGETRRERTFARPPPNRLVRPKRKLDRRSRSRGPPAAFDRDVFTVVLPPLMRLLYIRP